VKVGRIIEVVGKHAAKMKHYLAAGYGSFQGSWVGHICLNDFGSLAGQGLRPPQAARHGAHLVTFFQQGFGDGATQ
jgi:hypothetical protein